MGIVDLGRARNAPNNNATINITMGCHGLVGRLTVPIVQLLRAGIQGRLQCPECGRRYRVDARLQVQAKLEALNDNYPTPEDEPEIPAPDIAPGDAPDGPE